MNREEYNKLFHKLGLNRVAFKAVNDCDEEILALVNAAIAAEREAIAKTAAYNCTLFTDNDAMRKFVDAIRARGQL